MLALALGRSRWVFPPILRNLVAAVDVLLLLGTVAVLLGFVYRVYFRRVWRARRIANLRLKRILEERERGR